MGQVGFVNHLAPIVLPLGFNLGRGKLWPVVVCSWAGWTVVAVISAVHSATGFQLLGQSTNNRSQSLHVAILTGLAINAIAIAYLLGNAAKYQTLKSPGLKPTTVLVSILLAFMIASILLWRNDLPACGTARWFFRRSRWVSSKAVLF